MDFQYSTLWRRLQRFPATEDIVVTLLTADYVAMKTQRGECVPFLTRNMTSLKVDDPAISAFPLYDNGMYVVYERSALSSPSLPHERERALRRKQLFVVFPTFLRVAPGQDGTISTSPPFLSGDHFSFMVSDKTNERERLQFHMTRYPGLTTDYVDAKINRDKDNMPLRFSLPANLDDFKQTTLSHANLRLDRYARPLHALFLKEGTSPLPQPPSPAQDGGAKKRRASTARQRASRAAQERGPHRQPAFEDLWYELPLHAVLIIGVRRPDGIYDVSVKIQDRLNHQGRDDYVLLPACRFTSPTMQLSAVTSRLTREVVQAAWNWDTFVIPNDDSE